MSNTQARIWLRSLLGVAAIVAVPVILVIALRSAYQSSPDPGGVDRSAFDYQQPKEALPPIYECHKGGQVIYSGQPCGPDAVRHDVDARKTNTYTSEASEVSRSQANAPALSDRQGDECAQVQEEIGQINARMRQSYSSSEGEWYRERLRKLNDKLNELKCGR
jgi:hypothetical protein